jgi:hypothetical protein
MSRKSLRRNIRKRRINFGKLMMQMSKRLLRCRRRLIPTKT